MMLIVPLLIHIDKLVSKLVTVGYTGWQAAISKNILIYREAVKRDLVVKIDQGRFLPAEMYEI